MTNRLLFPALTLMLAACPDGLELPTDDTDIDTGSVDCDPETTFPANGPLSAGDYTDCAPYTGETRISYFPQPTCGTGWEYTVELKGTAGGMNMYSYDHGGTGGANAWGEEHPLTDGAFDENGWWDAYSLSLEVVTTPGAQTDGTSSLHSCATNNGTSLIWAYEALSSTDSSTLDCIVLFENEVQEKWRADFLSFHSGANLGGCDEVTGWTAE